jgi:hypothetical protein
MARPRTKERRSKRSPRPKAPKPKTSKRLWPAGHQSSESKPRGQIRRPRGKTILDQL